MCCVKEPRFEAELRAKYPDPNKEYTFYKVVTATGLSWNEGLSFCKPGVCKAVFKYDQGGVHCYLDKQTAVNITKVMCTKWSYEAGGRDVVVPVKARMRDLVKAGSSSPSFSGGWGSSTLEKQVVFKRIRIDKRDWVRAVLLKQPKKPEPLPILKAQQGDYIYGEPFGKPSVLVLAQTGSGAFQAIGLPAKSRKTDANRWGSPITDRRRLFNQPFEEEELRHMLSTDLKFWRVITAAEAAKFITTGEI